MQNGGKKWSGSRSDSILFQFSFSFRERWNAFRALKKQKNENNTTLSLSSSKRRRRQRRRQRRRSCYNGRTSSWVRGKKGGIVVYSPGRFFSKTLNTEYHKETKNIFARTNQKKTKKHERERKSFFLRFFMHCFLPMFVVFTYTLFYTRFYACATF